MGLGEVGRGGACGGRWQRKPPETTLKKIEEKQISRCLFQKSTQSPGLDFPTASASGTSTCRPCTYWPSWTRWPRCCCPWCASQPCWWPSPCPLSTRTAGGGLPQAARSTGPSSWGSRKCEWPRCSSPSPSLLSSWTRPVTCAGCTTWWPRGVAGLSPEAEEEAEEEEERCRWRAKNWTSSSTGPERKESRFGTMCWWRARVRWWAQRRVWSS